MTHRLLRLLTLAALIFTLTGCGGNKLNRQAISGNITYKGKPIVRGTVTFAPADGSTTQVSASIEDGKFSIPKEAGPVPGKYLVRFEAFQQLIYGATTPGDPTPPPKKLDQQPLPAKYGAASKVEAVVKDDPSNVFTFDLD